MARLVALRMLVAKARQRSFALAARLRMRHWWPRHCFPASQHLTTTAGVESHQGFESTRQRPQRRKCACLDHIQPESKSCLQFRTIRPSSPKHLDLIREPHQEPSPQPSSISATSPESFTRRAQCCRNEARMNGLLSLG